MTVPLPDDAQPDDPGEIFRVTLRNFEGPFDLLLSLISQQRLDVTEVALHKVTDDFIAYTRRLGSQLGLDQTTEFLVVAATLLDLKAARLLPSAEVEDNEDLALLDARDLLFARLLQYRAFMQLAQVFSEMEERALRRYPRSVSLEDRFTSLLPDVVLGVTPERFAEIAAAAFRPRPVPEVNVTHMHAEYISVPAESRILLRRLRERGAGEWVAFPALVADCDSVMRIVARFLSMLELYREKALDIAQPEPLGALQVSWTGVEPQLAGAGEDYAG
ncbi:segregation and condensation protein A [Hoyosella altamirensis]|uniref:Segregation and condensation protein A n=1 Tax=Hoyosella altamirensis TaxID=616997 RepID=A0A839RQR8_9ACTN|nr:segregation/condensation protein A [Hoyosella altamirensis]MBB3038659.1 segregation and condensation protein A [Hoyosella altamirensis]